MLLWAFVEKIRDVRGFLSGLAGYRLLPPSLIQPVGTILLTAELAIGLALVTGIHAPFATLAASVVFAVFVVAIAANLARGNSSPCLCFGVSDSEQISWSTLARAVVLLVLAVIAFGLALGDPASIERHEVTGSATVVIGLVLLVRLLGFGSLVWSFFKTQPATTPTPTRRVSFRHQPLDVSLRVRNPHANVPLLTERPADG